MIQYSDEQKNIIRNYNSKKNLTIKFLDDDSFENINGDRIYWESLNLIESLCDSDNLIFGSCESSEMQIQVADVPLDIKNHEIQLDLTVDEIFVPLGIFFIADVEKATDKRYKKLKCYDRMYYMQTDVIEWYNSIFPTNETTMTLKEFRNSFFNWMGLEQEETTLVNDNMIIRKTIDATELSGFDVIKAICEINGAFGHFNRYGIFQYVYLDNNAVYPSETLYPRDDLYPGGGELEQVSNAYYIPPSEQNDYIVRSINKLQIRQEDGDIGAIVTSKWYTEEENNSYIVNSNFLVYGNSAEELDNIAKKLSTKIFGITYTPNSTNAVAMPYMEVGDGFYVSSSKTPFTSYILKRTLSGIQGMRDLWEAKGDEFQPEIVSGSNQEIIQLRSRVNILTRTVDENKLEISRVETDLKDNYSTTTQMNSAITQSATSIKTEVSKTLERYSTTEQMNSAISQSANNITLSVSNQITETKEYAESVAKTAESNAKDDTSNKLKEYSTTIQMNAAISVSATEIKSEVSETYETKDNAKTNYSSLSTSIEQNANAIILKADKNGIIGYINVSPEEIKISADKLELNGIATFMNDSGFVTDSDLGADGTTVINGGRIDTTSLFSRDITATNFNITGGSIKVTTQSNEENYIVLTNGIGTGTYKPHMIRIEKSDNTEWGTFGYWGCSSTYVESGNTWSSLLSSGGASFSYNDVQCLTIKARPDGYVNYTAKTGHEFHNNVVLATDSDIIFTYASSFYSLKQMLINHGWM